MEYGANWIHGGSDENELFSLARRNALLDGKQLQLENRTKGLFYTSAGQSIDGQFGELCYRLFFDAELEAERLYRADSRAKQRLAKKSLLEFLYDLDRSCLLLRLLVNGLLHDITGRRSGGAWRIESSPRLTPSSESRLNPSSAPCFFTSARMWATTCP